MRDVRALVHASPDRRPLSAPGVAMTICERCGAWCADAELVDELGRRVCADSCVQLNVIVNYEAREVEAHRRRVDKEYGLHNLEPPPVADPKQRRLD
jgi:hypothetical protein